MSNYGYCRVSSKDQNLDRQILAMKAAGIKRDCFFCETEATFYRRFAEYRAAKASRDAG